MPKRKATALPDASAMKGLENLCRIRAPSRRNCVMVESAFCFATWRRIPLQNGVHAVTPWCVAAVTTLATFCMFSPRQICIGQCHDYAALCSSSSILASITWPSPNKMVFKFKCIIFWNLTACGMLIVHLRFRRTTSIIRLEVHTRHVACRVRRNATKNQQKSSIIPLCWLLALHIVNHEDGGTILLRNVDVLLLD